MMSAFTAENIQALAEECSDLDIVVHDTIGSTNTWALHECKAGRVLPFACFAEQQTAGKGRRGKTWLMSKGANIAMSLAWPFRLQYQDLQLLPLTIAMSIVETLESFGLKHVQIKWPNDVYVEGKKIAGILVETQMLKDEAGNNKIIAVVIGIGLNYDMSDIESSFSDEASLEAIAAMKLMYTDLCVVFEQQLAETSAVKPERLMLASKLLQCVNNACQIYSGNPQFVLNAFRQKYDYCQNKAIDIIRDDQSIVAGVAKGVTDNAELIVEINGKQQLFNSAEVSIKTGVRCR